ncbi:hypothetical protein [Pseudactinotalea suaedae]|uniref:hypothetical protein n=1 Tax=Pseudactinotalea suaedae TaxID=1524924 RepID=UPI0012E30F74|nr:hypothetical protein [Pseudactinotalea suaedae]
MSSDPGRASWHGEQVQAVTGGALTVLISPERGGKIVSLRDREGGEWLCQPAGALSPPAAPGAVFVDAEMCGWDECAPSTHPCTVGGRPIPDHGDLWTARFRAGGDGLEADGTSLGYRFRRRVLPTDAGARIEYEAQALTDVVPFLWAAHPQLVAPPGARVELGEPVEEVVEVLEPGLPRVPFTPDLAEIDTVVRGGYRKWNVPPERAATSVSLIRGPRRLTVRMGPETPYLGIWFDAAAFSNEPTIAIEPSTGYVDALDVAIEQHRATELVPGRPLSWTIELEVAPA